MERLRTLFFTKHAVQGRLAGQLARPVRSSVGTSERFFVSRVQVAPEELSLAVSPIA